MAEPFLSEIRIMSFGFAPKGWAMCDGQLLPINQNQALFSLLGISELPQHTHVLQGSSAVGDSVNPRFGTTGYVLAQDPGNVYASATPTTALNAGSVGNAGGGQAHVNMQPFLTLIFAIALQGIFPSAT